MLRLPSFEFRSPRSVSEAVACWSAAGGNAMYVAGGTDLLPNMKRRQFEPPVLIGIRHISELQEFRPGSDSEALELGGGVTLRRIAEDAAVRSHHTALSEVAGSVPSPVEIRKA